LSFNIQLLQCIEKYYKAWHVCCYLSVKRHYPEGLLEMKREMIQLFIALMVVVALPTFAMADIVKVESFGPGMGIDYKFDGANQSNRAGQINIKWNGVSTWSYCVDLEYQVRIGNEYGATSIAPPPGAYLAAAYLADMFRAGADTHVEAAALQAAIWESIYGSRFELTDTDATLLGYYDTYVAALPAPGTFNGSNYVYLDLYTKGYPCDEKQDLITGVPEPGTLLLMGLGLIGLAGLRRKE
jgi:hypothetical protein